MDDTPLIDTLREAVTLPGVTAVAEKGGVPVAVYGVVDIGPGIGCPWLLGTTMLDGDRKALLTDAREIVQNMMQEYEVLTNFIWEGSHRNRRWLRHLGFKEMPPKARGDKGNMFIQFLWEKSPCAE